MYRNLSDSNVNLFCSPKMVQASTDSNLDLILFFGKNWHYFIKNIPKVTYQSVFLDQSQTVNLYPLTRNVW